ncbi:YdcF family protein [Candidatus Leptofilum sp.]|uniref:YdcF family protein n=1 Tax=Candidatus Leptofilum sp. TaxID=3241576 RepID=UPI003B590098
MKIVVLLGNENDREGNLSPVAISRADTAVRFLNENDAWVVLPTGAFGAHFNTTEISHGQYLTAYLLANGISANQILPHTNSSNTVEDAICAKKVANEVKASQIIVISSEFHMRRVKYIFSRVFQGTNIDFLPAPNQVDEATLDKLQKHEVQSLQKLQKAWESAE